MFKLWHHCRQLVFFIDKTKVLLNNGSLMKVKSIVECSNTFDLHLALISLKILFGLPFEWPLKTGFTVFCVAVFCISSLQCSGLVCGLKCGIS